MENIGYYNGKFDLIEKMTVPMNDRAMYFGDGVYDATYSVNRTIFALEDHLDRFYNSCRLLEIPAPMPREELKKTLYECVNKVDDPNQFVYWEATRGTGIRNHVFPDSPSNLLIYTRPCPMKDLSLRYKLATMEDKRFYYCNVKTLNLIPSVLASQRALEKGCDETVFHRGDLVTECAHSNVSIIKDGKFITHQLDCLVTCGNVYTGCLVALRTALTHIYTLTFQKVFTLCCREGFPSRTCSSPPRPVPGWGTRPRSTHRRSRACSRLRSCGRPRATGSRANRRR